MRKIITLLTDFGTRDGYSGIMKGVICGIAADVQIIDIAHDIQPQNIREGALTLSRVIPYFPPGSIHVAVVDPGVGTVRRPIAASVGESYLVGPDNGLFFPLFQQACLQQQIIEIVHLDRPEYWRSEVSHVFHGRDIFAPVAAHLANGILLEQLGSRITDPVEFTLPEPQKTDNGWRGEVIHVDSFGNLATNIQANHLAGRQVMISLAGVVIPKLDATFGDGNPGDLLALIDSDNYLAISVVNGSAEQRLNASAGIPVEVIFH